MFHILYVKCMGKKVISASISARKGTEVFVRREVGCDLKKQFIREGEECDWGCGESTHHFCFQRGVQGRTNDPQQQPDDLAQRYTSKLSFVHRACCTDLEVPGKKVWPCGGAERQ